MQFKNRTWCHRENPHRPSWWKVPVVSLKQWRTSRRCGLLQLRLYRLMSNSICWPVRNCGMGKICTEIWIFKLVFNIHCLLDNLSDWKGEEQLGRERQQGLRTWINANKKTQQERFHPILSHWFTSSEAHISQQLSIGTTCWTTAKNTNTYMHRNLYPDIPVNPNSWVSGPEPRTEPPAVQPKQTLGYLAKMTEWFSHEAALHFQNLLMLDAWTTG